jgi:hypothetical protein
MGRRLVVPLVVFVGALAAAGGAGAQEPVGDAVTGDASGCLLAYPVYGCVNEVTLRPDAHSGPAGENPRGTVDLVVNGGTPGSLSTFETNVTCLSVRGHVAVIGVSGTRYHTYQGVEVPTAGLIRVTDGGGPASGADTFEVDTHDGDLFDPPIPGPTDCSTFPTGIQAGTNEVGDLTVIDAPSAPASKAQCKNGGWRNYEGFKNQGQCVSFVGTRGDHSP